ncbi:hypothetical protein H9L39_16941 [Fusarium oxysporum f. sp. albedinis]|nr:hypothetical protein H9L39_16941 [Fusarium oxysporum f. sp. albedinis]
MSIDGVCATGSTIAKVHGWLEWKRLDMIQQPRLIRWQGPLTGMRMVSHGLIAASNILFVN